MLFWVAVAAIVGLSRLIVWYSSAESQGVAQKDVWKLASLVLAGIVFFLSLPVGIYTLNQSLLLGLSILLGGPAIAVWLGITALQPAQPAWSRYSGEPVAALDEHDAEGITYEEVSDSVESPAVMPGASAMPTGDDRNRR